MTKNVILLLIVLAAMLIGTDDSHARTFELVKSRHADAIYYVDDDSVRHTFPNRLTYESWYGKDFSKVRSIDDEILSTMLLGKNVTIRSGTALVKVPSLPEVYAVEPGGYLRHITDVSLAENLYGLDWEEMVVDIPEVFFTDYTIGKEIKRISDIPNGVLYKLSKEETLYWKDRNILRRFASPSAVRDNLLDPNKPLVNSQAFFTREDVIENRDHRVFNPAASPFKSTLDCEATRIRIGFVYLHKGILRDGDVQFVQHFQNLFPKFWKDITHGLSTIDTAFPLKIIEDSDFFTRRDEDSNGFIIKNEAIFEFYKNAPDTFDALYIFTDFPIGRGTGATYTPITNAVNGIGKVQLDRSSLFGSSGKLKGVITMGNINLYSKDTKRLEESALERMSHELLHQWSGSLVFQDDKGVTSKRLLTEDGTHWNPWVTFTSPLGGLGWQHQGGGSWTQDATLSLGFKRKLPKIDLYTMGLLPAPFVDNVSYLDTVEIEPVTNTFIGTAQTVSIDQIISASGERSCWAGT